MRHIFGVGSALTVTCLAVIAAGCVGDEPGSTASSDDGGGGSDSAANADGTGGGGDSGSSDSSSNPDTGPTWAPTDLSGTVLWLDASNAASVITSSGLVTTWKDLTLQHNDAAQSNSTYEPTVDAAAKNGHAAVRFSPAAGSCRHLEIPNAGTGFDWDSSDFAVEIVAKYVNDNTSSATPADNYAMFFSKQVVGADAAGFRLYGNGPDTGVSGANTTSAYTEVFKAYDSQNYGVSSATTGSNDGAFHIFGGRLTGTHNLEIRVDGVSTVNSASSSSSLTNTVATSIGGDPSNKYCVDGDIAEVVAYKGTLSDMDLATLETYFKTKYALP